MRQVIIVLIAIAAYINCRAQTTTSSLTRLLELEKKAFTSVNDTDKAYAILEKIKINIDKDYWNIICAFHECKRIDFNHIKDSTDRVNYLWNGSILAYLNDNADYGKYYLNNYHSLTSDSSAGYFLLALMLNKHDIIAFNNILSKLSQIDTTLTCLSCLTNFFHYERKHRKLFLLSSAIIPGLGTIFNGYYLKGINSLLINSGIAYGLYYLYSKQLYFNVIIAGITFGLKFYLGNLNLTNKLFYEREDKIKSELADKCKLALNQFLIVYPVNFR